jgi:hypothetical protein
MLFMENVVSLKISEKNGYSFAGAPCHHSFSGFVFRGSELLDETRPNELVRTVGAIVMSKAKMILVKTQPRYCRTRRSPADFNFTNCDVVKNFGDPESCQHLCSPLNTTYFRF